MSFFYLNLLFFNHISWCYLSRNYKTRPKHWHFHPCEISNNCRILSSVNLLCFIVWICYYHTLPRCLLKHLLKRYTKVHLFFFKVLTVECSLNANIALTTMWALLPFHENNQKKGKRLSLKALISILKPEHSSLCCFW